MTVLVRKHPDFERKGNDLFSETHIDLYTAVLGGKASIHTLTGKLTIDIPEETQNDKLLRLRGKGMPYYSNPNQHGDLYVRIKVDIPTRLNDQEKKLFKELTMIRK